MADTFKRAGTWNSGYNPDQVDSFLTKAKSAYAGDDSLGIDETTVRSSAFQWVRNGYDPRLVDAALDRLEAAFIQRRRARVMESEGEDAWLETAYALAQTLYPRLLRPDGEKFADADGSGYAKADVDELMGRLADYFSGNSAMTSTDLRSAIFDKARGAEAYSESVVDVYIDRAVTVLLAVE